MNYPEEMTIFTTNSWNFIAIRDLWWINSRPVIVANISISYLGFFCFSSKFVFLSFLFPFLMKYRISGPEY